MPTPDQAHLRFMVRRSPELVTSDCSLTRAVQAIFFGANDACLPSSPTKHHVPLDRYKQNLRDILLHASVVAQNPRLILITPPPIDEYKLEEHGLAVGINEVMRTAEHTKQYADACREVGLEFDVAVLDIWSILMAKTGWREGETLIGSKKVGRSSVLDRLLVDGQY
ncbi:hypothetical protein MMC21_005091 [Puttea exsequens]|nr:hypothetical protein [Puttea exsequens]